MLEKEKNDSIEIVKGDETIKINEEKEKNDSIEIIQGDETIKTNEEKVDFKISYPWFLSVLFIIAAFLFSIIGGVLFIFTRQQFKLLTSQELKPESIRDEILIEKLKKSYKSWLIASSILTALGFLVTITNFL